MTPDRSARPELRDHIEQQTAANLAAGLSPSEARRAALVSFGGVERETSQADRPDPSIGALALQ